MAKNSTLCACLPPSSACHRENKATRSSKHTSLVPVLGYSESSDGRHARRSTTSVLPHEASAKQLVNAYVRTLLPVLRRGIGMMICETNEKGGMPLGKDKEHAIYALKIVKPGTSDVTGIDGTTLIESIGVASRRSPCCSFESD